MKIDKEQYNKLKHKAEGELRNYPYYLISLELPGLGEATKWDEIKVKCNTLGSPTEKSIIKSEYMRTVVNAINYVYDRLDDTSKKIIDLFYYRDDWEVKDIQEELRIDKNRFYKLKRNALYKFMIVLGYL
ncbi:nitroreductase [Clostridium sp. UBA5712]|uniref:nitroreductase n=1 Tax=Clostridium sp. UBA5712 TaxID=1946368 RepID=UPI0032175387